MPAGNPTPDNPEARMFGTRLKIRFKQSAPVKIKIKRRMKNPSGSKQKTATPSPFEIVALLENPDLSKARKIQLANKKLQALGVLPLPKKSKSKGTRQIEFQLEAPEARTVLLVGDFTDWEKSAIEMTRSSEGVWQAAVSLAAGQYAYRFIVDGHWRDDPRGSQRAPNPFGTHNMLLHVG